MSSPRILVVDDEVSLREPIAVGLQKAGYIDITSIT